MTTEIRPWADVSAGDEAFASHSNSALLEHISPIGLPHAGTALAYEMTPEGLRATVVDVRVGLVLVDRVEPTVSPRLLDRALAEHLVALDRVARPQTPEWAAELIDLLPEVRARVAGGSGAFAIGHESVGMFRVAQDDLDLAWAQHREAAAALGSGAVSDLPAPVPPVDVVIVGAGCDQWPGLFTKALADSALPVVRATYGRTNGTAGAHAIEQDRARTPETSRPARGLATRPEDLPMTPDGPRYYMPPTLEVPRSGPTGRRFDRRLVIGAGAIGVSAAIGAVIVATPWIGGSSDSAPAQAAATSDVPMSDTANRSTADSPRPPLDLAAARAPIVAYTAPAPVQTRQGTESRTTPAPRRRPAPPPAPRHRTIPNPIPGLPPIVLP